jgi:hypothetical protein
MSKVKRGIFEMPDFDEDVAALIKQMLTVDPTLRPSIEEIKRSSCFRWNLDENYVAPAPIPFSQYSVPVDPTTLSEDILSILRQIGYSDEDELRADLQVETVSMAKVFVATLTAQVDLERLPWDESFAAKDGDVLANETFLEVSAAEPDPDDPFRRGKRQPIAGSSLTVRSIPSSVDWCVRAATIVSVWIVEDQIDVAELSVWTVMAQIQVTANELAMQYFHPDPITTYLRTPDGDFYVSVLADFAAHDKIRVRALMHKGKVEQFETFKTKLWLLLREEQCENESFVLG